MATKKTNKTNHVLNLLSTGVKKDEDKEQEKEIKKSVKKNNNEIGDINENKTNISVTAQTKTNDIAEQIRKSLENEFQQNKNKKQEEQNNEKVQETKQTKGIDKETTIEQQPKKDEEIKEQEKPKEEAIKQEPIKKTEEDFIIVNIMEHLVKEKVEKYMEQFKVCTCSRCKADVMALALSGLPSKYVVINKNAVSPLLNFYSVKYTGQITVEITKAVMAVMKNPRHKK